MSEALNPKPFEPKVLNPVRPKPLTVQMRTPKQGPSSASSAACQLEAPSETWDGLVFLLVEFPFREGYISVIQGLYRELNLWSYTGVVTEFREGARDLHLEAEALGKAMERNTP